MSDGHELDYVRTPVPLVFPSETEVPETKRHLKLRTLAAQVRAEERVRELEAELERRGR